ncbi:MAG: helix-turn-helix transcriptional regulator [Planctomycetaceae bacterium]|nr:helix-turn-helix transcriptional regulator [Planctomycetaceae bacterium]
MSPKKSVLPENRKRYSKKNVSTFSVNVQKRRLEIELSQAALGEKIGVPASRISDIEGGRFPYNPDRIIAIADALDVSLDWLFGREWPKP